MPANTMGRTQTMNNTTKQAPWTPGPWESQKAIYGPRFATDVYSGMRRVARCANSLKPELAQADAKLIAKAPEMVEALQITLRLGNAHGLNDLLLERIERILREAGAL